MAYSASNPPRMILPMGFSAQAFASGEISKGAALWVYCSSDASSDVGGVVGYGKGWGAMPSSNNAAQPNLARQSLGMRQGDIVFVVGSSAALAPGLADILVAKNSSFNQVSSALSSAQSSGAGFDITLSSRASS